MLEDQVAYLLQRYLGNYVRGLNKEALKISVWRGDVELTNMQLKPEALNALKLPVKVKAGFLGSVKLKVPWSRLGQEPVLVYLDQIFILAEPSTHVEGCSEDTIQEAKKTRVREMEMKLLESQQLLKSEMNASWLGSLINTIIGNLKLSITNVHIRYEDLESNPGHPFAAGVSLHRLSAVTVDDNGVETFATGGALERIQKSVELECLALYFDSNCYPWRVEKPWQDMLPSEWIQMFEVGQKDGKYNKIHAEDHSYILQPVSGNARYMKLQANESKRTGKPLQKAVVNLNDVTLCLSKDGYRDMLKLADNFNAFNQRLKYAHYRPPVPVKVDPRSWWKYAYKVVVDDMKKASGKFSWDQVLKYARLRKKYVTLYASLLKSDANLVVVDDNEDIGKLDHELDIEVILQWRMLAHKFLEQSTESDVRFSKEKANRSWWSFGWGGSKDESEPKGFTDEDWERLNKMIGYKEDSGEQIMTTQSRGDLLLSLFEIHMKHNASKLSTDGHRCLAELSCDGMDFSLKIYPETKNFDFKLGSYRLSSLYGLLAESATISDSLVGMFSYKPFNSEMDWSFAAKASPCYMTYLKDSVDEIISFFKSSTAISQTIALETAAAVQMTLDEVRRTAQQQVTRALKDHTRFSLDLDIAAPKITIPTKFFPDEFNETKLLLDLGNLMLSTKDYWDQDSHDEKDIYLQFNMVLSDVSAFLVDGNYSWNKKPHTWPSSSQSTSSSFLPVIDQCMIVLKLQQIQSENPFYPSMRVSVRLPSLGFYFSPARYHRLMKVVKIFEEESDQGEEIVRPWSNADIEGWASILSWKGMANREAIWQRRYLCLAGPFLYVLESPASRTYKQYLSLRGKQVLQVPVEFTEDVDNVLAVSESTHYSTKVLEDVNALILKFDTDESRKTWQNRFQAAIYRASGSAAVASLSEISTPDGGKQESSGMMIASNLDAEKLFVTGVLDELRICFSCGYQNNQSFTDILLAREDRLFEFRATGGQVELSSKGNDLFIGTVLKSLEIEDQFLCERFTMTRYLARSFVMSTDDTTVSAFSSAISEEQNARNSRRSQIDTEEQFFEASDSLVDPVDYPESQESIYALGLQSPLATARLSIKPPSFKRIAGLLADATLQVENKDLEIANNIDSFVKAQVVFYHQDSPLYSSIDKRVSIMLATLSFFCHRPTILAILQFVNAINYEEDRRDTQDDRYSANQINNSGNDAVDNNNINSEGVKEPVVKGLLGRGKSRAIFYLTLSMAKAQIFLVNENGSCLATLSENNFRTDIKVFPSSFNINAALGNLKISDDSLPNGHSYFWVCNMRNPGGSSFVELDFSSFSVEDDDYQGYDYSLVGQFSEVRIVYLNRFVQEIISYFTGLVPGNSNRVVKLKDQSSNSERLFTTNEIEGSPALKLDVSLSKPIIVMPRRTDSPDYLELDVVHITVGNTFHWVGGDKNDMSAAHLEMMTIQVQEINLSVGTGDISGENIIEDVKGLSIVIQRSLRDLLHQIPLTDAVIKVEELRAALSNREYQIIKECSVSNMSETPRTVPPLDLGFGGSADTLDDSKVSSTSNSILESVERIEWISMKASVAINLVELCLYSGSTRDMPLATIQAIGASLLYKANSSGESFIWATLKGFTVIDDREGTRDEFRHTIGKHENRSHLPLPYTVIGNGQALSDSVKEVTEKHDNEAILTMLILDVMFKKASTSVSLCIQRPHLLVALDFLMATAEFFVPTVRTYLSEEGDEDPLHMSGAIILDKSIYTQPSSDFFLSPRKPLIVDDERFDHYIYDGNGGNLYLKDSQGIDISCDCAETIVFVGNGKRLQFRNLFIKNGEYLDSCIFLGSNSSYSVSEDDNVFLERGGKCGVVDSTNERMEQMATPRHVSDKPVEMEYLIELQAIGPELTFYNSSKDVSESLLLSNKVLHAELDVFCRLALKGDSTEITGDMLGLKVESNGIRVLEPFDTSVKFSNISGRTNINIAVSDIFMNFSYSMMMLFLAVEEDILAFIRMTAKKVSVTCSQFDKVGTIINNGGGQTCAFWRPRTPPGFAVLGDCLTPLNEPPSKGVLAVNTSFVRVKRPVSYKLIWPPLGANDACYKQDVQGSNVASAVNGCTSHACSIWFPVAPPGYVAVGCVVSAGRAEPPLSSTMCILSSLVSPCSLRDCISLQVNESYSANLACWRVENSFGSFLVTDSSTLKLHGKAYELRQLFLGKSDLSAKAATMPDFSNNPSSLDQSDQLQRSSLLSAGRLFEAVASFKLIWWNQGSPSPKKLSIWRPVVPPGMFYFGDIAVQGYEPPNACFVLHDSSDDTLLKPPPDFRLVGQIRRQRRMDSISFWLPQAPSGYVPLGCIATRGSPKLDDFNSLRCIRSDMVTGDQFPEESIWETSDPKMSKEPFSIWSVGNEVGTFIVRRGFRKPPKRFALRLADLSVSSRSDNMVVDAQIKTLSAAIYDDYSGLMVPLFNVSLSGIGFSMRGRSDYLNSTVNFSLAARSYNDKYDSWEPLIEPIDGFLRYQYDLNSPGAVSQLRLSSTRDLNLNISTSNMNMILQAYSSWNSFSHIHESYKSREIVPPSNASKSVVDLQHKRDYYIIPQNKLGQEIYVRPTELKRYSAIIKMQSGENKPIKVPVSKNLLDSHLEGKLNIVQRSLLTIVIFAAELPAAEGLSHGQYTAAVRLFPNQPSYSTIQQQSARTSSAASERFFASGLCSVNWNEMFFFRVDLLGYYMLELIVTDLGTGQPIGFYSSPLENIALKFRPGSNWSDVVSKWTWRELSSPKSTSHQRFRDVEACGRIKCAVFLPSKPVHKELAPSSETRSKPGFIQISPSKEGPWTTVRLNYATPAACWRLGNDVVASELTVINGTRYVNIRSLVSVTNSTEFVIELRLKSRESNEKRISVENRNEHDKDTDSTIYETDMFFEIEKYVPAIGWVNSSSKMPISMDLTMQSSQGGLLLPSGWEWIDDWHIDNSSVNNADGWVYAPDIEHLRWPESVNHEKTRSTARQRKWIRHRKYTLSSERDQMPLCLLKPGDTKPLPLQALVHPVLSYILQLRPTNVSDQHQYSWSMVKMEYGKAEGSNNVEEPSEFCLSALNESEIFMYCSEIDGNASNKICGLWYRLSIEAVEIGKDMHLDPIQDWKIIVDSPLSITNYLPLSAEYSILTKLNGQFLTCFQRNLLPGENVKVYRVDLQEPLYVSLQLQGWEPMHESVLISHPHKAPSRAASLTSSFSGRVIQIIFEQDQENVYMMGHHLRVYVPYWIASARCPPLKYKFMDISKRKDRRSLISVDSVKNDEAVLWQITEEEMVGGCTIASAISFKPLGLSVSMGVVGKEHFGPIIDLSPLGDMDGSLDTYAYDADGKSFRIFISSKPCPYPAVPTKVITVRPFLTFANRTGQDLLLKLSANDDPKVLYAHDSRISFTSLVAEVSNSLQVQVKDMEWSYPIEIINEDTFTIMLRKQNGGRGFLRVEIRVYEEGFLVVFRLGTSNGLIRVENRMAGKTIGIRQSGLDDDAWMQLEFFSSTDFSWENPYGSKTLDVCFDNDLNHYVEISLENSSESSRQLSAQMILLHILEVGGIKVARFTSLREALGPLSPGYRGSPMQDEVRRDISPMELIIELGVVGVSLVDHKPRELLFLYLERVFISYSTGYDAGATSRFKLIVGQLQLDNQLPLTVMPVLLAPENITDMSHPVFKTTITMRNQSTEGTQIYPYVYVRVTDTCWRLNIHEPIIWALAELYNNIHLDRLSGSSDVIQVDPEIRIDLIDVSEIRLKLSLETAPTQRPHGVLGIWSPILSAVGNALKIQIHLRKVMHRNRFMRKSSIIPSVLNRIRRDLIHDPLHLIFSVDVLGMTKSTFASLSKGFAELSTDGQFLQLRSKQVWSRRITGVSDGILQGTEALAQGVAFGVSGVVRKPLESARQHGMLGFARGLGHAFLGFIVQPVSGALDFVSLTVDGISASFARCLEILSNKATVQRIRNPRAIRANGVLKEYDEKEAVGQMILYLAEASRHLGCTDLFKEPSKFAWSDYYEDHFNVPFHRILLVTNKRIMLLQCLAPDKMDKRPCKIIWDVPWEELLALELAKAGYPKPSHLIIHIKNFKKPETFVRLIKCSTAEEESEEPQAVRICSAVRKMWRAKLLDMKTLILKVPSSQRHVQFACEEADERDSIKRTKPVLKPRELASAHSGCENRRFIMHIVNFQKIWSSELETKSHCTLCPKQVRDDGTKCSIWRPSCPDGYISVGDIARIGIHPPNVASVYRDSVGMFASPLGYDLVWRNCLDDYAAPVSVWHPRAPEGFVSVGCVAVASFEEPHPGSVYCVSLRIAEETAFENQAVWTAPDSYPWACYFYQVQSEALHFIALRQRKEQSDWKPMRVSSCQSQQLVDAEERVNDQTAQGENISES